MSILRALSIALFIAAVPIVLLAQQSPVASESTEQEVEAMFLEFQRLHMRLEELQDEALRDPGISAAQEALGQEIQQAMENRDPTMREQMARAMALETEAQAAQRSGDTDHLDVLIAEAQSIQDRFIAIQQEVVTEAAMAQKIMAFQNRLETKMMELNPEARELIARFRELEAELQTMLEGGV